LIGLLFQDQQRFRIMLFLVKSRSPRAHMATFSLFREVKTLTKTLDFSSTPQAIGHALSHSGAHQSITRVTGKDGSRSVHG